MYTIINFLAKICGLIGFGTIPFTTSGLISINNGIVTIILAFIFCAVLECGIKGVKHE